MAFNSRHLVSILCVHNWHLMVCTAWNPSYGHWYRVFRQLKISTSLYLVGIVQEWPINVVSFLFLRVFILYGVYVPIPVFFSHFFREVRLQKKMFLPIWLNGLHVKDFIFSLSYFFSHINSYTTETQNVQCTLHYSSKCFEQISKIRRKCNFQTCCFVASVDIVT